MADQVTFRIADRVYDANDPMTAVEGLAAVIVELTNGTEADRPDPTDIGFYLPAGKIIAKLVLDAKCNPMAVAWALAGVGVDVAKLLLQPAPAGGAVPAWAVAADKEQHGG